MGFNSGFKGLRRKEERKEGYQERDDEERERDQGVGKDVKTQSLLSLIATQKRGVLPVTIM